MKAPLTQEAFAARMGCTLDQVLAQRAKNLEGLRQMHAKAVATGRKVNGYAAAQLAAHIARVEAICAGGAK